MPVQAKVPPGDGKVCGYSKFLARASVEQGAVVSYTEAYAASRNPGSGAETKVAEQRVLAAGLGILVDTPVDTRFGHSLRIANSGEDFPSGFR
jgi:hypothetical protein